MTPEPEMTVESAKKIIDSFPPEFNSLALPRYYYKAQGFLSGHAAGVKESQALVKELVEGYELILKSNCCPPKSHHGNTCPRWIAEEALESARRMS